MKRETSSEIFKKSKGGILLPNESAAASSSNGGGGYEAIVEAVGEEVDLAKAGFKIGDVVIFNDYDTKKFGDPDDPDAIWGLCKAENIWATYTV